MRVAVVSDIHGNLAAFEAVAADLRETSPDLILHGGDLADSGSSPAGIVDRVRELGWQGVLGNTDEMLVNPESLEDFAKRSSAPQPLFDAIREMAAATREKLGPERLAWLRALPRVQTRAPLALVHASPASAWRSATPESENAELEAMYGPLGQPVVVYGHVHRSFIRAMPRRTVANAGSVSLSYDGEPRASYLLVDDFRLEIRRVEYEVDQEIKALASSRIPHSDWVARMLVSGRFEMP